MNSMEQSALNFLDSLSKGEKENLNTLLKSKSLLLGENKLFTVKEKEILRDIENNRASKTEIDKPSIVVVMKSTRACNLRCSYCNSWEEGKGHVMSFDVLAKSTYDALSSEKMKHVTFVWHGGEPLLLPISYYKKAIEVQKYFSKPEQVINNSFQTNGTKLNQEWIDFFKENNISIGISIDGIKELHDKYRVDTHGSGTWEKVVSKIDLLNINKLKHGILMVITKETIKISPVDLYESLIEAKIFNISFLNSIPGDDNSSVTVSKEYLPFVDYVVFLKEMYEIWKKSYEKKIDIREFTALEYSYNNNRAPVCLYSGNCFGRYLTVNSNGDIGSCDKYVTEKDFIYGNLNINTLSDTLESSEELKEQVIAQKKDSKKQEKCKWYYICHGGCPHDNRMNSRYDTATDECCGLSSLLDDIDSYHLSNN